MSDINMIVESDGPAYVKWFKWISVTYKQMHLCISLQLHYWLVYVSWLPPKMHS
jgi:hypothetical protein